jgi:hypothetical protein
LAALAEEVEHGGAAIDGEGLEVGLVSEELGEEATVAVAEDEGAVARGELREEVIAGAEEERAEGEVLGPAIEAGYAVEVRRRGGGHFARGRSRTGVRRTRSAAARRWRGEMWRRRVLSSRRAAALRAQARAGRPVVRAWCGRQVAATALESARTRRARGVRWAVAQRVVLWAVL